MYLYLVLKDKGCFDVAPDIEIHLFPVEVMRLMNNGAGGIKYHSMDFKINIAVVTDLTATHISPIF